MSEFSGSTLGQNKGEGDNMNWQGSCFSGPTQCLLTWATSQVEQELGLVGLHIGHSVKGHHAY